MNVTPTSNARNARGENTEFSNLLRTRVIRVVGGDIMSQEEVIDGVVESFSELHPGVEFSRADVERVIYRMARQDMIDPAIYFGLKGDENISASLPQSRGMVFLTKKAYDSIDPDDGNYRPMRTSKVARTPQGVILPQHPKYRTPGFDNF